MPIDVMPGSFHKFAKIFKRFELILKTEKPTFKNDYEYVDYALSVLQRNFWNPLETLSNDLEVSCNDLRKSSFESEELRKIGNVVFKDGRLFEAHNLYTMGIAYARAGSLELALAYGNRSAVLFEKQYYKECLEDIKRAFENNYPQEKKAKLLQRQKKAKELLPTQKKVLFHDTVPKIKNQNPNMPSASECIKVNKDDEFGRHIVANRNINSGEILLVEKPYTQFILPEFRSYHCSECFELCLDLIPCEKCAGAMYCSKVCRRKSYVNYHRYECVIFLHYGFDIINWNAVRFTLKGIKDYEKDDVDPNIYRSDRFKEISKLISHRSGELETLAFGAAGAARVFYILKHHTDFFFEFDVDDRENVFKALLLNNIFIDCNNSFHVRKYDIITDCNFPFGRAIYSTLSMFNHACNENVGYSFYGTTVVLKAKKKIKKGEQVFLNYGVDIYLQEKTLRQEIIQEKYHFTCKCRACVENWPKQEKSSPEAMRLLPELALVTVEISSTIDRQRKRFLLSRILNVIEKLEPEAQYGYCKFVLDKVMLEGNGCPSC